MSNYISNGDFLKELKRYQKIGIISKKLHHIFYLLSERIATKSIFYRRMQSQPIKSNDIEENYQDFIHEGYLKCIKRINNFDIENRSNPFAYFTSVIINTFKDFFYKETRYEVLKVISQNDYEHRFLMKWGIKITKEYEDD